MLRVARSISLRISGSNSALTHCMPGRKGARRSSSRTSISCSTGRCIPTSTIGRSGAHGRVVSWHSIKWAWACTYHIAPRRGAVNVQRTWMWDDISLCVEFQQIIW
ncbi:hypothetical protein KSP39_PZI017911 [Platanthera zijinensis]|uniref:Uncharacterized protein n=1 Tax=Platanthera zijinensis TaxID=2320716 RepID=A0AAP0B592_9ASPA